MFIIIYFGPDWRDAKPGLFNCHDTLDIKKVAILFDHTSNGSHKGQATSR